MTAKRGHERHCLVVMSHGQSPDEIRWFNGWYNAVLKPALELTCHIPVLPSPEGSPHVINDEMLTHLASDPMVVLDLGGMTPDVDPSPHVLYALGMRQALNLPHVMLAWKGQRLPFDGKHEHVIIEGRAPIDLATNRTKLRQFIQAAEAGKFYRPIDSVG